MQVLLLSALFIFTNLFQVEVNPGDEILGTWVNEEQTTHIEIYKEDGRYFGKIVWIPRTTDENGNPITDRNNPDDELRERPLVGIDILKNFEYKKGEWKGGTIYSPKNGKSASPTLEITSDDELKIKIKRGIVRRSITWTRL